MDDMKFKDATIMWEDKGAISLAAPEAPTGPSGISLASTVRPSSISPATAQQRAEKYNYALGEDSPGTDVLNHSIRTGDEYFQRRLAATKELNRRQQMRSELLMQAAAMGDGTVDEEMRSFIMGMAEEDFLDPSTYFEKAFSRKFISEMAVSDLDTSVVAMDGTLIDTSAITDAFNENPEQANFILDAAEIITAKREIDHKLNEDYNSRWEAEGWGGKGISDTIEMATPFLSWYRMSNLHEKNDSLLLGNNLKETYENLALITDVDEYKRTVETIAQNLYAKNGYDAIMFLKGLVDFNTNDQMFGNFTSWIDMTLPLPVVGVTTVGQWTRGAQRLGSLVGGSLRGASGPGANKAAALAGAGNLSEAGMHSAVNIMARTGMSSTPQHMGELMGQVQSVWNPNSWFHQGGLGHMEREAASRIVHAMETNTSQFAQRAIADPVLAGRIEPGTEAATAAKEALTDLMNQTYGRGSDIVIDISLKETDSSLGVQFAEVKLGNVNAELYPSEASARFHADEWYGIKGPYEIVQHGDGYYISVSKPISEDSLKVRQAREHMATETRWASPKTWANLWIPRLRSKDSLTSLATREDTITGTMGKQALVDLGQELFKPINNLSRNETERLEKFLSYERDFVRGRSQERGKFSEGYVEFEQEWFKKFNQLPNEKETLAYMTSRQLNDYQYTLTNLALYRDKTRKGMEMYGINGGETAIEGVLRTKEDLWRYEEDAGFLVYDFNDDPIYTRRRWLGQEASERAQGLSRTELQNMLDSGNYKVIQISDVGETVLRDLLGEAADQMGGIEFVIAKNVSTAPLPFKQLPYNPGGHVGLEQGYMARVANLRTIQAGGVDLTTYYGDRNLFHFQSLREAQTMVPRLNRLRELYLKTRGTKGSVERDVAIAEMKQLLNNGYVPVTMKELARIWGGKRPKYDPTQPIYITRMDESIEAAHQISKGYANWTQKADSVYDLYKGGIALEWTGKRGGHTFTMINEGTWSNPTWKRERAKYIEAIPMLERSTRTLLRDRYLGHIKHNLGDNFLANHIGVLDLEAMGGIEAVRADPLRTLHRPIYQARADKKAVAAARNERRAALELLDMPSTELEERMRYMQHKIVQDIFDKHGVKQGEARAMHARNALTAITSTPAFLRSFAFDWKLGLFNPVQLLLQGLTTVHALGVAGLKAGGMGIEAAMLQRAAIYNPDHLKALSKMAPGWKPEHFEESFNMAKRLGWYRVGKEYATIDDVVDPALGTSRIERAREFMRFFFKEGERFTRMTAWNAAYSEWRRLNPTKAIDNAAGRSILDRANILSVQMTSASNAQWQKGIMGIPTQFFAYHARLTEQFLGTALTPKEKIRLFATYSAAYGLPVSLGAPVGLWEVGQSMKEWLIENDYDVDGDLFTRTIMDGLVGVGVELATGVQTSISQRVGPSGLPFLEDLLSGEKTTMEALGGVSGQTMFDAFSAADPLFTILGGAIRGENSVFDITWDDIQDILRTSSTGNNTHNLIEALNTGRYITKSGQVLDNQISPTEAWLTFFGAGQPMRVDTAFKRLENTREREAYNSSKVKLATREFARAWRSDNDETIMQHIKRAQAIMDHANLPRENRMKAFEDSRRSLEPMIRNIGRRWADRDPQRNQLLIDETNKRKNGAQ